MNINEIKKNKFISIIDSPTKITKETIENIVKKYFYKQNISLFLFFNNFTLSWDLRESSEINFPINKVALVSQRINLDMSDKSKLNIVNSLYNTIKETILSSKIWAIKELAKLQNVGAVNLTNKEIRLVFTFKNNLMKKKSLVTS